MNKRDYKITFLSLVLCGFLVSGQVTDTIHNVETIVPLTSQQNGDIYEGTGDFSPMQFFFVLILLGLILLCIGASIILIVLGLLFIFGLVSFGIVSASVIVGINRRSVEKGFKTFLILSLTIGGLLVGGTSFWILNKIVHWWTDIFAIFIGSVTGLLTGLGLGFLACYVLQQLTFYFRSKLDLA